MNTENENLDFEVFWVYSMYENGESVTSIAAEIGKSEAYVYAKVRRRPDKYEDVKVIREETRNIRVRRISSLADRNIETYLEGMQGDSDKAGEDIDKINVAESTLTAIMGRISAYTGKPVRWRV